MKTHRKLLFILLLMPSGILCLQAEAQERSESVIGFGISPGVTSFDDGYLTETNLSLAVGFKVGHKIFNGYQVYLSTIVSPFGYKYNNVNMYGLVGFTLRYFISNETPSIFVVAGGDIGVWGNTQGELNYHESTGPRIGGGYEFAKHWNVEGTFSWLSRGHNNIRVSSFWTILSYEI